MNRAVETMAVIALLALLFATSCTRKDDELSAQANALIELTENTKESLAYLYLLGMEAPEGVDPIDVGRRRLEGGGLYSEEAAHVEKNDAYSSYDSEGPLGCNVFHEGCLAKLFTTEINIEKVRLENSTIISRSNTFYNFDEYRSPSILSVHDEVVPQYRSIVLFERIAVLGAISNYHDGRIELAIESLLIQIDRLRQAIELQDGLVGKLVFLAKLSEVVDVASIILSDSPATTVSLIPSFSFEEKDLQQVAAREFVFAYEAIHSVRPKKQTFGHKVVRGLARYFFKPNMTLNAIVPVYTQVADYSHLSHAEFSRALQSKSRVTIDTPLRSNLLGHFLVMNESNYGKHVARFHDIDAKLALFNHRFHLKGEFDTFENPYYPGERPVVAEDRVCFRGPIKEDRTQCLRIQINPTADHKTRLSEVSN